MTQLARIIPAALVLAATAFLAAPTHAAPGGGHGGGHRGGGYSGHHGGGPITSGYRGGYHGGYRGGYHAAYRGGYRGGYGGGHWARRSYWGPGPFWGGLGLGLGVGAVVYSSGLYGSSGGYYAPYDAPYDDGFVDGVAVSPEIAVVPSAPARIVRSGQAVPLAHRAPEPIFYPVNGQSAAALENDRRDCNRWATTQPNAMADASVFQRATYACMEGRGYTVR